MIKRNTVVTLQNNWKSFFFFSCLVVGLSDTKECIIEIECVIEVPFIDFTFGGIKIRTSTEEELNIQNIIYPLYSHNGGNFIVGLFKINE